MDNLQYVQQLRNEKAELEKRLFEAYNYISGYHKDVDNLSCVYCGGLEHDKYCIVNKASKFIKERK